MSRVVVLFLIILGFSTQSLAAVCCAHWGADGTCHHEYTCADTSDNVVTPRTDDDYVYTRNEDGDLQRSCCAHWGADGSCYHEYQCNN
jgi:hypothetical protein